MGVKFKMADHRDIIFKQLDANIETAMPQIADAVVDSVQNKMLYGYHTPHGPDGHTEIVDTGRLFDSITAEYQKQSQNLYTVNAGVPDGTIPAEYVQYVHDGTYKLEGRPFLRDGVLESVDAQKEIYQNTLPNGFR